MLGAGDFVGDADSLGWAEAEPSPDATVSFEDGAGLVS
ncbi:hypothetical protein BLSMQ_0872 [Brevibacterium aurantiacum]|uniref:Uncharacterized protein n=1 Tax=Brevibacterium aurantiacum TaxID=273384 RepID=A0A1D7W0V9_BREAU|nr:hypothetical protein BLSMQ_0872 [Brevibacterium aurantiacum]